MKAYVIMPYGGDSVENTREYNRIYRFLIQDSINNYDPSATILRQDHTGEGGGIVRNVISNLAEADIVVADLSNGNWNVAYELGIRHVMNKFGTILLCNDRTELPYDVKHMNVIGYPADGWMDDIEAISEQITKAIKSAMEHVRSDSPVFDVFPALPENLVDMVLSGNETAQLRLRQLADELDAANEEISHLRARIEEAGLDSTETKKTKNLQEVMRKAAQKRMYISDEAVSHLRKLADERDYDEFCDFLAKVLEEGYLDESDCRSVYIICRKLDIPEITKIYLETVVEFYPDNEELKAWLADAYSTDYHDRDKALSMVNESLGIRRKDGKYELIPKVRSHRLLGAMFDVYLHLKKYQDIIAIGDLLLDSGATRNTLIIHRNICLAAIYLEDFDRAKIESEELLRSAPDSDTTHHIRYRYLDAIHDHFGAYEALENCIRTARSDDDYYFMVAAEICDERVARCRETLEIRKIDDSERESFAVPFILRAFFNNPDGMLQRATEFLKRNNFYNTIEKFTQLLTGKISREDFDEHFDYSMVDYCYKR